MYCPVSPAIPRKFKQNVWYKEYSSPADVAYCLWTLQTKSRLDDDFHYLVLPDGCIDIVFDLSSKPGFDGALVMTPNIAAESLNLGHSFHYVGIRFRPGAWLERPQEVIGHMTIMDTLAQRDMSSVREELKAAATMRDRLVVLEKLIAYLEQGGVVGRGRLAEAFLASQTVDECAQSLGLSRRHLQRLVRDRLGYTPHDFLKIVRFQQALRDQTFAAYADQSHYIREFRRLTGLTPEAFHATYA